MWGWLSPATTRIARGPTAPNYAAGIGPDTDVAAAGAGDDRGMLTVLSYAPVALSALAFVVALLLHPTPPHQHHHRRPLAR